MKGGVIIAFLWYFFTLFIHSSSASHENDGLYGSILQEYKTIIEQVYAFEEPQSCENACVGTNNETKRSEKTCHCDKQCVEFGDCCLDYWESCSSSFSKAYEQRQIFECLVPEFRLSNVSGTGTAVTNGYEVVTKCPSEYQDLRLKTSCEDPQLNNTLSLLFVEGADGRTYRNQYCAECHGVASWKHWKTALRCAKEVDSVIRARLVAKNFTFTTDERKTIREECDVLMKPNSGSKPIDCAITTQCKNKTNPDYKTCGAYMLLLYTFDSSVPIRNPHCARCNNVDLSMVMLENLFGGGPGDHSNSLAILFDFSKASDIYGSEKISENYRCKTGEIYDFSLEVCRAQRIIRDEALRNWTCELANETFPNTSDHIVVFKNQSILVVAHNKVYNPDRYHWHGANVTVCGNLTTTYLKSTKRRTRLYTEVEFYLTLVGFSLSILALLAVILTYALFEELRTLPGKIIINLAVALLLTQLVFLFDMVKDVSDNFCTAIAVVLHYLFIASFCWMNAMAFDVSRTFAGKSHRSPSGSRRKPFLFCLLYGWGLPVIIVCITLAVNHSGAMDVGYGNRHYCWITNPIALAVFFAVPVVAMLLFNIIALVRVLVAVRRVRRVTKTVRDRSTAGQDVGMCWKLTAVFGITWILGLGAGHHIVLRIVYIICNSLQGVFIMVGFIMTRRILNLYLKKAGKMSLTTQTTSRKSTITTSTMVTRKTTFRPLQCKAINQQKELPEEAEDVVIDEESPEARLISKMEGPETRV